MRFVAALVILLAFAPAARADVTFTGVPTGPTNLKTFDVGFASPGADHFDCVHVFPDLGTADLPGCTSPFEFRDLVDGRHELRVTATDAAGAKTEGTAVVTIDTVAPPAPTIESATVEQRTATLNGTTTAGTTVAVFEGTTRLGAATVTDATWTFVAAGLARGTHTLTAVAFDAALNGSDASAPRDLTIAGPPLAPTITLPAENAALGERMLTLSGTSEAGTTVTVYDGETRLGETAADGTTWAFTTAELAEGAHTLKATATDTGGTSPEAVRHVTIDTVAPEVTIADVPALTNAFTFDIGFTASEPVRFDCVHLFPGDQDGGDEFLDCHSPFELREGEDGTHTLRVTATDAAGNTGTDSVSVTIDTQPPAAVEPVQTGASEFTFAGEAGASFECALDGAGFAPCSSPQRLSGLAAGEHRFAVLAVDAAGNRSAATTRTFSIAAPPVATPVATVVATPAFVAPPPAVPAAELGRTLVARTVSGKIYVRRPATSALLDLGTVAGVPVGTEIDARKGRVRLTAAARPGKAAHRAEFFGGVFIVTQAADDVVDLQLSQPFGSCAKKTGTRSRKLWGDGKGRFRMRGLNSIATVRGTRWLVQDSCEGTLTRVSQGLVSVRDTVKRKTFLVRAGRKYLAVPKKRK